MRGKVAVCGDLCNYERITPAYAGKRKHEADVQFLFQDHPRLCGEKKILETQNILTIGSPPPMRGKAKKVYPKDSEIRITPAYAGKSGAIVFGAFKLRDHPRLCGEK